MSRSARNPPIVTVSKEHRSTCECYSNMRERWVRGRGVLTDFRCPTAAVGDLWIEAEVCVRCQGESVHVGRLLDCTIVFEEQI